MHSAGAEIGRERFVRTPEYLETEPLIPALTVKLRLSEYEAQVFRLPPCKLQDPTYTSPH